VSPTSDEVAERIFARRPPRSRVTAWASTQSAEVVHRVALEALYDKAQKDLAWMEPLERPPHWRAYRLVPRSFEFWAARGRRLHDRLLFTRLPDDEIGEEGGWRRRRLQP
jgi:pyridoxamine 5'-phosphate oxidase